MRLAAFEQVRRISEVHGHLTGATEFEQGLTFEDRCIPIVNRQRDIFKPKEMRFLLSIRTIFPKPGGRVWYHDQRHVHQQIFEGSEAVDYAIMGTNPDAADNRWLRAAYENRVPVIYFPGIAPSVLSFVKCRIKTFEFHAGIVGGELPIHLGLNAVACQAATSRRSTSMRRFRRIMTLSSTTFSQLPCLGV